MLPREATAILAGHRRAAHLRRDDVLLAHSEELPQHAPRDDLALAAVVDVGRVEEDDAPSTARRTIGSAAASSSAHSRLSCLPKLIIPRHSRETRRPVLPRFTYCISSSLGRPMRKHDTADAVAAPTRLIARLVPSAAKVLVDLPRSQSAPQSPPIHERRAPGRRCEHLLRLGEAARRADFPKEGERRCEAVTCFRTMSGSRQLLAARSRV